MDHAKQQSKNIAVQMEQRGRPAPDRLIGVRLVSFKKISSDISRGRLFRFRSYADTLLTLSFLVTHAAATPARKPKKCALQLTPGTTINKPDSAHP